MTSKFLFEIKHKGKELKKKVKDIRKITTTKMWSVCMLHVCMHILSKISVDMNHKEALRYILTAFFYQKSEFQKKSDSIEILETFEHVLYGNCVIYIPMHV